MISRPVAVGFLALLLLALGPVLAQLGVLPPLAASRLFGLGGLLGLLAVAVGLWFALKRRQRGGWLGALLGATAFGLLVFPLLRAAGLPPINDVATDPGDPPEFRVASSLPENHGRNFTYDAALAETVTTAYPDVRPFYALVEVEEAFGAALEAARAQPGWTVTHVDAERHTLEAVVETRLFRFRDDVVIRVRDEEGSARIDVRSKSREGKSDLGANAERIRAFYRDLAQRLE